MIKHPMRKMKIVSSNRLPVLGMVVAATLILGAFLFIGRTPHGSRPKAVPSVNSFAADDDEQRAAARAKAAILGALVADAASMGMHWIYDQGKLLSLLEEEARQDRPEFFDPPFGAYYKYTSGAFSPYGDELLPVVSFLAEHDMDGNAFAQYLAAYYKAYPGRLNHSSKRMLENVEAGKKWPETGDDKDAQANAFVKVPAIVARYAGDPLLPSAVDAAVRAQQNNDASVGAAMAVARVLERVVLGSSVKEALEWAVQPGTLPAEMQHLIKAALSEREEVPFSDVAARLGLSCGLPHSLQNCLVAAARFHTYTDAVRANILAGGDNCSRSVCLGALLAAEGGLASIPAKWRVETQQYKAAEALADKVVGRRQAAGAAARA